MPRSIVRRPMKWLKLWRLRLLLFFAVVGPGFITANVDNDPNGIYTYSAAGAGFGYSLLWTLIPVTIALIVIQEMCARMGAVTGKGLSDLIREEKIFLVASLFYIAYIVAGALARPAWKEALISTVTPPKLSLLGHGSYLYLTIAVIGTTIAPWMQFYLQASVVEKGVTVRQY